MPQYEIFKVIPAKCQETLHIGEYRHILQLLINHQRQNSELKAPLKSNLDKGSTPFKGKPTCTRLTLHPHRYILWQFDKY